MKYKMKAIVGMPGSGKSTVGHFLGQMPEFVTMDFGKVGRSLSNSSYLGAILNNCMKNGESFSSSQNLELLNYILTKYKEEKTFDPTTQTIISCGNFGSVENVDIFKIVFDIDQLFVLEIDERIARERLVKQKVEQKRWDENLEIIDRRFLNYKQSINLIIKKFDRKRVHYINANNDIANVLEDIKLLIHC